MLSGFSPKQILAYDPYPNVKAAEQLNVKLVSFEELLEFVEGKSPAVHFGKQSEK